MLENPIKMLEELIKSDMEKALDPLSDKLIDYRKRIEELGWKTEMIPGEKVIIFRANKGKTYWERRVSRLELDSAYDPSSIKWQIWKEIYNIIKD